jgi:hypothetical protein
MAKERENRNKYYLATLFVELIQPEPIEMMFKFPKWRKNCC